MTRNRSGKLLLVLIIAWAYGAAADYQQPPYRPFKSYKHDTVAYLRENFVINKKYYLNRPLGYLINKLEVPAISYSAHSNLDPERFDSPNQCTEISLFFHTDKLGRAIPELYPNHFFCLGVRFKNPPDYEQVMDMAGKYGLVGFAAFKDSIKGFYSKLVIDSIFVLNNITSFH